MTLEEMKNLPEDKQKELFAQLDLKRKLGKTINYGSVYGAGAATISRSAKVSQEKAQKMLDGYWALNHSVEKIAEEQYVITCDKGLKWLVNPVNGFCYSLRGEKDRFSTLCQGTGSFFFEMWVDKILEKQQKVFGKKKLTACQHDDATFVFKNTDRNIEIVKKMLDEALQKVNEEFMLRRSLGCDTHVGFRYSEIH